MRDQSRRGRSTDATRFLAVLLCALLATGAPATVGAAAPEGSAPGNVVSVATEPAGAAVYMDGEFQGAAPVELARVPSGDHRVTVVKDGYLENSRVVSVSAGQPARVQVKLTPQSTTAARYQVDRDSTQKSSGGGGSGKKIALIGLGVVAVGAGVYLATKESNKAPTVGSVVASPTVGLASATAISFSAQGATDPDNDTLTYDWNFGDGTTGSGATVSHTYANAGTLTVTVKVSDPKGLSATGSGSVTIKSVSGTWRGAIAGFEALPATVSMSQSGANVTGSYSFANSNLAGSISGSVSAPLGVRLTFSQSGFVPFTYSANADAGVDRLSGTVTGSGFTGQSFTLTRQ